MLEIWSKSQKKSGISNIEEYFKEIEQIYINTTRTMFRKKKKIC